MLLRALSVPPALYTSQYFVFGDRAALIGIVFQECPLSAPVAVWATRFLGRPSKSVYTAI